MTQNTQDTYPYSRLAEGIFQLPILLQNSNSRADSIVVEFDRYKRETSQAASMVARYTECHTDSKSATKTTVD